MPRSQGRPLEAPGQTQGDGEACWVVSARGAGLRTSEAGLLSGPPANSCSVLAKLRDPSEPPWFSASQCEAHGGRIQWAGVCKVLVSCTPDTWIWGAAPTGAPCGGGTPRGLGVGVQATLMADSVKVISAFHGRKSKCYRSVSDSL